MTNNSRFHFKPTSEAARPSVEVSKLDPREVVPPPTAAEYEQALEGYDD